MAMPSSEQVTSDPFESRLCGLTTMCSSDASYSSSHDAAVIVLIYLVGTPNCCELPVYASRVVHWSSTPGPSGASFSSRRRSRHCCGYSPAFCLVPGSRQAASTLPRAPLTSLSDASSDPLLLTSLIATSGTHRITLPFEAVSSVDSPSDTSWISSSVLFCLTALIQLDSRLCDGFCRSLTATCPKTTVTARGSAAMTSSFPKGMVRSFGHSHRGGLEFRRKL
mmetsp:Transcript_58892/g.164165  ORF Transcript_58892/g.164165 Transcript_58892/m.164165 type:complete len:223 (+) Transcript_58892:335-1003(+)